MLPVVNVDNIPALLKNCPQWVLWRNEECNGKVTKVPCTITGKKAASNNPDTWTDFASAWTRCAHEESDGIGFVFAKGGGLVGVDLDDCFLNGTLHPKAKAIVDALNSYTEYSVSRRGLHVIVKSELLHGKRKGKLEIYPHGRYFTVTGHVFGEHKDIADAQGVLDRLVARLSPPKALPMRKVPRYIYIGNNDLIERAKAAKNGEKFSRLWGGDWSGYASQSEADLALLNMLLYLVNGDEERASILFCYSGLYRDKWDRQDYRRLCLSRLLGGK